jgi:hypothetical protein
MIRNALLGTWVLFAVAACSDNGGASPSGAGSGPVAGSSSTGGSASGAAGTTASGSGGIASTGGDAPAMSGSGGVVTTAGQGGASTTGGMAGAAGAGGMPAGSVKPVLRDGKWALDIGDVTFEVDPMVGGRITTFKLGTKNVLVGSADTMSPYYWGSTLWVSPEATKWMQPPPAALDQDAYTAVATDTSVTLTSAAYAPLGITMSKTFSVDTTLRAIVIEYKLNNTSQAAVQMAPWEVTRVFPSGLTFFPKGPTAPTLSAGATMPTTETSNIIWFSYDMSAVTKDSKLYADSSEGWVAHVDAGLVFIKSFGDVTADKLAPKEGDVELYANADHPDIKRYIEIEDQSAYGEIAAGASVSWKVRWFLRALPAAVQPAPGMTLAQLVRDTVAGK